MPLGISYATWVSCLIKIVSQFGNQYCSQNYFLHISIISLTNDLSFWKTNMIHPLYMFDITYYVWWKYITSFVYTSTHRLAWWRAFIIKSWWLQLAKQGIRTPSECLCTYFQFWFPGIHFVHIYSDIQFSIPLLVPQWQCNITFYISGNIRRSS